MQTEPMLEGGARCSKIGSDYPVAGASKYKVFPNLQSHNLQTSFCIITDLKYGTLMWATTRLILDYIRGI